MSGKRINFDDKKKSAKVISTKARNYLTYLI